MTANWDHRATWYERAELLKPELKHWEVPTQSVIETFHDDHAWQKTGVRRIAPGGKIPEIILQQGQSFTVDFGETLVGRIKVAIRTRSGNNDSPLRLRFYAAELPFEVASNPDDCHGQLSRAWLQDEIVNFDILPGEFQLPRRYSLRYLRIDVLASAGGISFDHISVVAEAAEMGIPPAPAGLSPEHAAIDQAGLRTLRNCMQLVMEDGPKRDRRLWLGDLRLQALPNSVSYQRYDLIERSLLLLAAAADDDGLVPGCVFIEPQLRRGNDLVDYSLLLAAVVDDLVRDSGNLELGRSLYPLAIRQFELKRSHFDANGLYRIESPGWHFIDWAEFDRQTAIQGVYIYSLKALARLATRLQLPEDAAKFQKEADLLAGALRRFCYDDKRCLMLSGVKHDISYAGQIWPILAGIFTPQEAAAMLNAVENIPQATRPATPYMHHHLLEAYVFANQHDKAAKLLDSYWGSMIKNGADTFWEAYIPGNDFLSPYNDPLLNSACHAWSCTTSYFLRKP